MSPSSFHRHFSFALFFILGRIDSAAELMAVARAKKVWWPLEEVLTLSTKDYLKIIFDEKTGAIKLLSARKVATTSVRFWPNCGSGLNVAGIAGNSYNVA